MTRIVQSLKGVQTQMHSGVICPKSVINIHETPPPRYVAYHNCIQEEIKSRLNSDTGCYHGVHNLSPKTVKIKL